MKVKEPRANGKKRYASKKWLEAAHCAIECVHRFESWCIFKTFQLWKDCNKFFVSWIMGCIVQSKVVSGSIIACNAVNESPAIISLLIFLAFASFIPMYIAMASPWFGFWLLSCLACTKIGVPSFDLHMAAAMLLELLTATLKVKKWWPFGTGVPLWLLVICSLPQAS